MNKEQRKFKKKKEKERNAKAKVRIKRAAIRKTEKERKRIEAALDLEAKLFDKPDPPYRSPEKQKIKDENDKERERKAFEQLEHNLKILEALEEEHIKEDLQREELNEELEAQGLKTVDEKVNYLKEKARKEAEEVERHLATQNKKS